MICCSCGPGAGVRAGAEQVDDFDAADCRHSARSPPRGGFWAEVRALPGCYSQAETLDELKHNIREAIAGVLEVLREQGGEPDSNIQILDVAV